MDKAAKKETFAWLFVRVSGVLVLFLALGHLYIMHIANSVDTIDADFVKNRLQNPLWKTYDFFLLALALSHGSLGVKTILEDVIPNKKVLGGAKIALGLFGLALFCLGLAVFIKNL